MSDPAKAAEAATDAPDDVLAEAPPQRFPRLVPDFACEIDQNG